MKIVVLCVGKLKEPFFREALSEYEKRLSRFMPLEIREVPDEKTKEGASLREEALVKEREGKRLLSRVSQQDFCVALDLRGKMFTSEEWASQMAEWEILSRGNLVFFIGGSLGLSEDVLKRADRTVSFSKMTFPHQLFRVILLEQLYRAYKIRRNEPYHK